MDGSAKGTGFLCREPAGKPNAPGFRNLDEAPMPIDRDPRFDPKLELIILFAGGHDPQSRERSMADHENQRTCQAGAMIGLLVAEVVGLQQHARCIVDALRPVPGEQGIGRY
jgi:hypothetical protein